jgi:peptide/nickel transport system ATP-binding protein
MLLEGKGLSFRYDNNPWLFQKLDVTIESGEVVGLIGPSGCGKTTLGQILAGHQLPSEGAMTIDGQKPPRSGHHPVQLVFQHPERAVNPRWRIHRTLMEGGTPDPELLSALGIMEDWLQRSPNELSGGELQRVCIARALGRQTRFLIADEMTTMLDSITQAQIWQAVLQITQARKLGLLVISHDIQLIQRICSRWISFNEPSGT